MRGELGEAHSLSVLGLHNCEEGPVPGISASTTGQSPPNPMRLHHVLAQDRYILKGEKVRYERGFETPWRAAGYERKTVGKPASKAGRG